MASPTQTVVGKVVPNPLTAEGLLKILRDLIPLDFSPKSLTNFRPWNGRTTYITSQTYHVNTKPLIVRLKHFSRQIKSISPTDQNSTCRSLNRMTSAFKIAVMFKYL